MQAKTSKIVLGKGRIEALSDGIFAIAMTLLVLDLKVPDPSHHMDSMDMVRQLVAMRTAFLSYCITFLLAGTFWYTHHLVCHYIRHTNRVFLWLNLLFLMMVSLLPFSAGLLTHLSVHPVSQLFYYGNQLMISALLSAQWEYARVNDMLSSAPVHEIQDVSLRLRVLLAGFITAVVTGFFWAQQSSVALLIALALGQTMVQVYKRRRRTAPALEPTERLLKP